MVIGAGRDAVTESSPVVAFRTWTGQRDGMREALGWAALVGAGLAVAGVIVASGAQLGTSAAPFAGNYRLKLVPASLLAPAIAVAVLVGVRRGLWSRGRWRVLLPLSYITALAWALALAVVDGTGGLSRPMTAGGEYLADVHAVGGDPLAFIRGFVGHAAGYGSATRTHPPGPVLLLWSLTRLGIHDPALLGIALTAIGCLAVPFVTIAVRSLCHDTAARRLLPALLLAPWAVWTAVSMDAVTAALAAGALALGVVGSEPGRRPWWAAASGVCLGFAALFGYSVAWLGVAVAATYFVRRRPLLNVFTGVFLLLPLWLFYAWGFSWLDGLRSTGADVIGRGGTDRAWMLWVPLDLAVLVIACGPVVVRAARRIRLTPGWPFLAGAVPAVLFGILSGLSRGEVERSWLPYFPWLLVPALAPRPRPTRPGDTRRAGPVPVGLIALGALTAVVVEACVASPW